MIEFSFVGPLYNNARTIEKCLKSIMEGMLGLEYEIIIVDNFSNDGSFEIAASYAKEFPNIVVRRHRCSRGRGRQIGFLLSHGKYLIHTNYDCYYEPQKLRQFVVAYKNSSLKDNKGILVVGGQFALYPRDLVVQVGGYRDLNRDPATDLHARLMASSLAVFVPISLGVEMSTAYTVPGLETRHSKESFISFFSRTYRSLKDLEYSEANTFKKAVLWTWLNTSYSPYKKIIVTLISTTRIIFFGFTNYLQGLRKLNFHPYLRNTVFVTYRAMMNMVSPLELGFHPSDVHDVLSEYSSRIKFIERFHPEVKYALARLKRWRSGVP